MMQPRGPRPFSPRYQGGYQPRFGGHRGGGGGGGHGGDGGSYHSKSQNVMMNNMMFDGKRIRNKSVLRKTVDYNASIVTYLENRVWQRDFRDERAIQPDELYVCNMVPPPALQSKPMNSVTSRFVRNSTNKFRCPIFCVCWTPEGRRLITGASSGEFTLWNGLTFNFETILQAHDTAVRSMVWSHNDQWMLTADHAGYVKYWQSNMNNVKMYQAHKEAIRGVSFCPMDSKYASCSDDGTVRIWDFLRCHEERILRGHGADVKCVDWHPQKALVVSGSKDTQQPLKLWDPRMGESLATIHAHKHTVMEVKWNRNGNWLLTASRDHLLKLFDIRNMREEMQVFKGHKKEAMTVAWHPIHESLFVSGGSDGGIMFWIVGNEKEVGSIDEAHDTMVWSLAWHPLGHILVSGSNDHTTKFWTRNRPGDLMRDKYNLNTLPMGMTEDMLERDSEYVSGSAALPGMGLEFGVPDHLKKQKEPEEEAEDPNVIPGLDWGLPGGSGNDKYMPKKKVPYAKPVPRDFQQAWTTGRQPVGVNPGEDKKNGPTETKTPLLAEPPGEGNPSGAPTPPKPRPPRKEGLLPTPNPNPPPEPPQEHANKPRDNHGGYENTAHPPPQPPPPPPPPQPQLQPPPQQEYPPAPPPMTHHGGPEEFGRPPPHYEEPQQYEQYGDDPGSWEDGVHDGNIPPPPSHSHLPPRGHSSMGGPPSMRGGRGGPPPPGRGGPSLLGHGGAPPGRGAPPRGRGGPPPGRGAPPSQGGHPQGRGAPLGRGGPPPGRGGPPPGVGVGGPPPGGRGGPPSGRGGPPVRGHGAPRGGYDKGHDSWGNGEGQDYSEWGGQQGEMEDNGRVRGEYTRPRGPARGGMADRGVRGRGRGEGAPASADSKRTYGDGPGQQEEEVSSWVKMGPRLASQPTKPYSESSGGGYRGRGRGGPPPHGGGAFRGAGRGPPRGRGGEPGGGPPRGRGGEPGDRGGWRGRGR